MLKTYWIITCPDNKFGPQNFGATAFTEMHARALLRNELPRQGLNISENEIDKAEVIENIDIRELDQNHIMPNMGVVNRLGIWFPNFNS